MMLDCRRSAFGRLWWWWCGKKEKCSWIGEGRSFGVNTEEGKKKVVLVPLMERLEHNARSWHRSPMMTSSMPPVFAPVRVTTRVRRGGEELAS